MSISASEAVSGLAAKFGAYVQNKSKLAVSLTATPPKSGSTELSSIKTYSTKVNGVTYSASSFTTGVLTVSGTISTTVTDSRGRTATASLAYTVVAYSAPKIGFIKAIRINDTGAEDNDGTRLKLKASWNISPINSLNDHTYKVEYKEATQGDEDYVEFASGIADYSYNSDMSFLTEAEFDTDTTYYIRLTITDYFDSSDTSDILSTSYTLLDFNVSGKGMAVGKVSERDGFELNMPMYIEGHEDPVGTIKTIYESDVLTMATTGSWQTIQNLTLSAGTWIIVGCVTFENFETARQANAGVSIGIDSASSSTVAMVRHVIPSTTASATLQVTRLYKAANSFTVNLSIYTSAERNYSIRNIYAMRIL